MTEGIVVQVESTYLPDESSPEKGEFVFSYTVTIANHGHETVQLRARHWIITDSQGEIEEVQGPGVVGAQPTLRPGTAFRYSSGCVLSTPSGSMHGRYQMVREDGTTFDAEIAPFMLIAPMPAKPKLLN